MSRDGQGHLLRAEAHKEKATEEEVHLELASQIVRRYALIILRPSTEDNYFCVHAPASLQRKILCINLVILIIDISDI